MCISIEAAYTNFVNLLQDKKIELQYYRNFVSYISKNVHNSQFILTAINMWNKQKQILELYNSLVEDN